MRSHNIYISCFKDKISWQENLEYIYYRFVGAFNTLMHSTLLLFASAKIKIFSSVFSTVHQDPSSHFRVSFCPPCLFLLLVQRQQRPATGQLWLHPSVCVEVWIRNLFSQVEYYYRHWIKIQLWAPWKTNQKSLFPRYINQQRILANIFNKKKELFVKASNLAILLWISAAKSSRSICLTEFARTHTHTTPVNHLQT